MELAGLMGRLWQDVGDRADQRFLIVADHPAHPIAQILDGLEQASLQGGLTGREQRYLVQDETELQLADNV
jgi:hypothetical protein